MAIHGGGAHTWVILCLNSALVLAQLAWCARAARRAGLPALARSALVAVRWLRCPGGKRKGADKLEGIVEAKMRERKLLHCLRVGQLMWFVAFGWGVLMLSTYAASSFRRRLTPIQDIMLLAQYTGLSLMQLFPQTVTQAGANLYYSGFMAALVLLVSPLCCPQGVLLQCLLIMNLYRFLLGMLWRPIRLVVAWDLLFCLSLAASLLAHEELPPGVPRASVCILVQMVACSMFTAVAALLESSRRAELRAAVDAEGARIAHSAAQALLRTFCEVVVDVGADGRISSTAWDLSSYLLRGRSLQGSRLEDLLSEEEDRALLRKKLRAMPPSALPVGASGAATDLEAAAGIAPTMAEVAHVRVGDGNGSALPMQLVCFRFQGQDGQPQYLVGLREFGDAGPDGRTLRHPWRPRDDGLLDGHSDGPEDGNAPPGSPGIRADAPGMPDADSIEAPEVLAEVDWECRGLPIMRWSPSFAMHVGRVAPGTPLLGFLAGGRGRFNAWFQRAVNGFRNNGPLRVQAAESQHQVVLRTRLGPRKATCTLSLVAAGRGEDGSEKMTASFVFSGFQVCQSAPREGGRGRSHDASGSSSRGSGSPRSSSSGGSSAASGRGEAGSARRAPTGSLGTRRQPHPNNTGTLARSTSSGSSGRASL